MSVAAAQSSVLRQVLSGARAAAYLPDAGALAAAGLEPGPGAGFLPPGARCVLLQALRPLPPDAAVPRSGLGVSPSQPALEPRADGREGTEEAEAARIHADAGLGLASSSAQPPGMARGELLVLAAERPRALSARERLWAAAVAAKLAALDLPA